MDADRPRDPRHPGRQAPYPWKVKAKGVRQVVGDVGPGETFELELDLVRASREEHVEGLPRRFELRFGAA